MPSWVSKIAALAAGLMVVLPYVGFLPKPAALVLTILITAVSAFSHAATGTPLPGGSVATIIAAVAAAGTAVAGLAGQIPIDVANWASAIAAALTAFATKFPIPGSPKTP